MGADAGAIREYAQAVEELGYDHIQSLDHVLGASSASRPGWRGPYDHNDLIHEAFVLLGFLAAVTRKLELVTSVIILPQRQTALVAKQAAEIDVLSGGRLRLGIGVGWNHVEYEALAEDFHNRGRRSEEQIEVMRALWTGDLVTFAGRWHTITDAGINPLPVQRPIPIWIGGDAEPVIRRIARIGDGWFPQLRPDQRGRAAVQQLRDYASEAGRDPDELGIDGAIRVADVPQEEWAKEAAAWRDIGATHVSVNTRNAGLTFPEGHLSAVRRFKETLVGAGLT
jgi:probable F420-dependent oxidoreductase